MADRRFHCIWPSPRPGDWYFEFPSALTRNEQAAVWRIVTGDDPLAQPPKLRLKGRNRLDVVLAHGLFLCANRRVVDLLEANAFTGWATFPLQVAAPKSFKDEFAGLMFRGKAGPLLGGSGTNTLRFDPRTWDGSDFFTFEGTRCKVVTARVVDVLRQEKVTGVEFDPVNVE